MNFVDAYRDLPDDKLLQLMEMPEDLKPEALKAVLIEIKRRKLDKSLFYELKFGKEKRAYERKARAQVPLEIWEWTLLILFPVLFFILAPTYYGPNGFGRKVSQIYWVGICALSIWVVIALFGWYLSQA